MKKFAELKDLPLEELVKQKDEAHKALFEARFKKAVHQLDDTATFRRHRHLIAQIKTIMNQREKQALKESN